MCEGSSGNGLPYAAKAVPQKDYFTQVEDPAANVARKAALSPWSKAWARKLSYDKRQSTFIHELEIPRWFHTCAVPRSLANARKGQLKDFCEKERYESCSAQRTCIADAFRKVRKGENVPIVLLLLGYTSVLLLRNPCVLYQKHGGACTMY
jgi:hypothetical protein